MKSLLPETPADFRKQRIFAGLAADAQISAVRFREPGALEPFSRTSLEVIDVRKIGESGDIIHEEFEGFAAPRNTSVELGIGLDEKPRVQIGAAKLVVTEPCVQPVVSIC